MKRSFVFVRLRLHLPGTKTSYNQISIMFLYTKRGCSNFCTNVPVTAGVIIKVNMNLLNGYKGRILFYKCSFGAVNFYLVFILFIGGWPKMTYCN